MNELKKPWDFWNKGYFHKTEKKYSKSQTLKFCDVCGDSAFELLDNKVPTNRCCRCGVPFPKVENES